MGLGRSDIKDTEVTDAVELLSTGALTSAFRTITPLVSITALTKTVVCPVGTLLTKLVDSPVEALDRVVISGATGGNGTYTVDTIVA